MQLYAVTEMGTRFEQQTETNLDKRRNGKRAETCTSHVYKA